MNKVKVFKISSKHMMDDFVKLPRRIYADCPQYVPDLDSDIRDMFNPKKNAGLENAEIQGFVAYDEQGVCVGRIAGIINNRANKKWNTTNVRFGLIEFVDDKEVSKALLEAVAKWGEEKGMTRIQGPLGIFDFDKEGMLVDDFDQMGSMITYYNLPYYPQHMEALGFEKEVDWVQIQVQIPKEIPAKYARVSKLTGEMFGLHVIKPTTDELLHQGLGHKVFYLFNKAYAPLFGYSEFTDKQIDSIVKQYLPFVDKRMFPIIEDGNGKIIGAAVTMGSLSHALHKSKGKLLPWGWFHLLRALKWKHEDKAELLLIGVDPEYQGLGVNALFFNDLIPLYNKLGFTWAETGPQLEDNVKELSQWKPLNPKIVKRRRCWTKPIQ